MQCRPGCGACCIVPSISSALPGMPKGKPAGVRCAHLTGQNLCALYGRPERPAVCRDLKAGPEMCGADSEDATARLWALEEATRGGEAVG
jgi:hypothetical protein